MRIVNAVYQLSEIQRTRAETRSQSGRTARTNTPRSVEAPPLKTSREQTERPPDEVLSLPEMLHQHFVDEVKRRDRDGDGRLSPHEYGGTREDFNALDRTGKGYVNAKDLTREALARNPDLHSIVAGRWAPVYEALMQVKEPTDESLIDAVRRGAEGVAEQMLLQDDETGKELRLLTPDDRIATITADFIMNHRELSNLHERLQTLADRLGRFRRYSPVDLVG